MKTKDLETKLKSLTNFLMQRETFFTSLALALLVILFFSPTFFKRKIPLSSDYVSNVFPWAYYDQDNTSQVNAVLSDEYDIYIPRAEFFLNEVKRGEYPIWNPYINSGAPSGLIFTKHNFSIYRLSTLLLGSKWGHILKIFLRIYLAGFFTYLYLRYRRLKWLASLSGSLVAMFSSYVIVTAGRSASDAVLYAPAILFFAEKFIKEKRVSAYIGLVFFVSTTIISGFPSVTLYTLILVVLYLAYRNIVEDKNSPFRKKILRLLWLYSAFLLSIFLVMFTLLPTYEFLEFINLGYREGRGFARLPWEYIGRLISPNLCGSPVVGNWLCASNYNETALYVGILPLMVLPFGFLQKKYRSTFLFFFFTSVIVFFIVFGVASLNKVVGSLPLFNINPNTRMIALLPLSFSFTTAIAIDVLLRDKKRYLFCLDALYWALLAFGTYYFYKAIPFNALEGMKKVDVQYFLEQRLATLLFVGSYIGILIGINMLNKKNIKKIMITALFFLLFSEYMFFLNGYHGESNVETFYQETGAIKFLKSEMQNGERVLILERHFMPSTPLYYSINSLTAHDHIPDEYRKVMQLVQSDFSGKWQTQTFFNADRINLMSPIIDLYRVRYIVAPPNQPFLWNELIAGQKEYNDTLSLNNQDTFGQSMISTRDSNLKALLFRLALTPDEFPVKLRILLDGDVVFDGVTLLTLDKASNWYKVILPELPIKKEQSLFLEITPSEAGWPDNTLLYSVNYDIYKNGEKVVNNKYSDEDIAFMALGYNSEVDGKFDLVYSADMDIYENLAFDGELPIVQTLQYATGDQCSFALGETDPFIVGIVDDMSLLNTVNNTVEDVASVARIESMSANNLIIKANISQTSMLVVSDTYYPGWVAEIDGVAKLPIHRLNCNMRGILLPPGEHTIIMSYRPKSFVIGGSISLFSFITIVALGLRFRNGRLKKII